MNLKIFIIKKIPVQNKIDEVMVDYFSVIFDVADLDTDCIIVGLAFEILAKAHPDDKAIKRTAIDWVTKHDLFSKYESKSYNEVKKEKLIWDKIREMAIKELEKEGKL